VLTVARREPPGRSTVRTKARLLRDDETASMRRLLVAGGAAALVTGVCVFVSPWQLTIIAAWSAAAITFLVAVGRAVLRADAAATLRLSTVEDDSRPVAGLLLVAAATASLTGVGFALARARDVGGMEQAVLTVVALSRSCCRGSW
jgi:uncharacterized membrane protein